MGYIQKALKTLIDAVTFHWLLDKGQKCLFFRGALCRFSIYIYIWMFQKYINVFHDSFNDPYLLKKILFNKAFKRNDQLQPKWYSGAHVNCIYVWIVKKGIPNDKKLASLNSWIIIIKWTISFYYLFIYRGKRFKKGKTPS